MSVELVFVRTMTSILFPVLYDYAEGIETLVSQTSPRFNARKVLVSLTYKRVYVESYKSDTDSTITGLEADA